MWLFVVCVAKMGVVTPLEYRIGKIVYSEKVKGNTMDLLQITKEGKQTKDYRGSSSASALELLQSFPYTF